MSNDDDVFICYEHFWCQYAHLPIAIAGLVGNLTSGAIFLLSQDFKERPLIKVLVTLAIVDSLYLVTTTVSVTLRASVNSQIRRYNLIIY